jgi:hypothetical protein
LICFILLQVSVALCAFMPAPLVDNRGRTKRGLGIVAAIFLGLLNPLRAAEIVLAFVGLGPLGVVRVLGVLQFRTENREIVE